MLMPVWGSLIRRGFPRPPQRAEAGDGLRVGPPARAPVDPGGRPGGEARASRFQVAVDRSGSVGSASGGSVVGRAAPGSPTNWSSMKSLLRWLAKTCSGLPSGAATCAWSRSRPNTGSPVVSGQNRQELMRVIGSREQMATSIRRGSLPSRVVPLAGGGEPAGCAGKANVSDNNRWCISARARSARFPHASRGGGGTAPSVTRTQDVTPP